MLAATKVAGTAEEGGAAAVVRGRGACAAANGCGSNMTRRVAVVQRVSGSAAHLTAVADGYR